MNFQTAQTILTLTFNTIALLGLLGIFAHAFYKNYLESQSVYSGYNADEWTQEQIEWSNSVIAAHKAKLESKKPDTLIVVEEAITKEPAKVEKVTVEKVSQPKVKKTRTPAKRKEVAPKQSNKATKKKVA
jgi:outer membrane biosynthesis protein TonB